MEKDYKWDLVMTAAKNVLENGKIRFSSPEDCKRALIKELNRLKDKKAGEEEEGSSNRTSHTLAELLFGSSFSQEDFRKFMKLFSEGCEYYGIRKVHGAYKINGENALMVYWYVYWYIVDHWDDPSIDFDTPERAKETLVNEIARIKKREETHEDFDRSMKLFDEACQKYGYQKRKDGSYHFQGDPVLAIGKIAKYINDHWFDNLKDDEKEES